MLLGRPHSNQFRNRSTFIEHRDWAAGEVFERGRGVDAHDVIDGREDVGGSEGAFDGELGFRVGGSDDDATFETTAGHHHADRVAPVVSAGDWDAGLAVVDFRNQN